MAAQGCDCLWCTCTKRPTMTSSNLSQASFPSSTHLAIKNGRPGWNLGHCKPCTNTKKHHNSHTVAHKLQQFSTTLGKLRKTSKNFQKLRKTSKNFKKILKTPNLDCIFFFSEGVSGEGNAALFLVMCHGT